MADLLPAGEKLVVYPADPFTFTFTWPTSIAGRTFTATLDGDTLTCTVDTDELSIPGTWPSTDGSYVLEVIRTDGADQSLFRFPVNVSTATGARTGDYDFTVSDGSVDVAVTVAAGADFPQTRGGLVTDDGYVDVSAVDVQEFTTAGTFVDGWVKPANLTAAAWVHVWLQQGGGGGGSGRKGAESSDRGGGTGATDGAVVEFWVLASDLAATEDVVVGAGGAGGAARSTNSQDGANGSVGGASTFNGISANSGNAGFGGSTTSVIANTVGGVYGRISIDAGSARPRGAGGYGASNLGLSTCGGGSGHSGGGGGGAWRDASNNDPALGAATGGSGTGGAGGAGGAATVAGSVGTSSTNGLLGGGGGGGGGRAANGGAGGWPGGGGGGGGVGVNSSSNSGAGGAGSHGYVRITTYR